MKTKIFLVLFLCSSFMVSAQEMLDYSDQQVVNWYVAHVVKQREVKWNEMWNPNNSISQTSKALKNPPQEYTDTKKRVPGAKNCMLGILNYLHIFGVPYDTKVGYDASSFNRMERSANEGYVRAKYYVAEFLLRGVGCAQDDARSYSLLQECYTQLPEAALLMSIMQFYGIGTEKDENKAFQILQALTNNQFAQFFMGMQYEAGRGVEQNIELAKECYTRARSLGYQDAAMRLALLNAQ